MRYFRTKRVLYNTNRVIIKISKAREKLVRKIKKTRCGVSKVERAMRIELTIKAWEAFVLPLNYARIQFDFDCIIQKDFVNRFGDFEAKRLRFAFGYIILKKSINDYIRGNYVQTC